MKTNLTDIFNKHGGDKGSYFTHVGSNVNIAHNYTSVYEKYMEGNRDSEISMLEIGLWCPYFPGSSIKGWNEYFTNCQYYGVDIVDCTQFNTDKIHISIIDQKSSSMLTEYVKDKPLFKYIIDDGCHEEDAIVISLGNLFPHLESGGIYFIEDLHVVDKTNLYNLMSKTFTSPYITEEQINYINDNIDICSFELGDKLCIIRKK